MEKRKVQSKVCRRKEYIEIRAKVNESEIRKTINKVNENINKMHKAPAKLTDRGDGGAKTTCISKERVDITRKATRGPMFSGDPGPLETLEIHWRKISIPRSLG